MPSALIAGEENASAVAALHKALVDNLGGGAVVAVRVGHKHVVCAGDVLEPGLDVEGDRDNIILPATGRR